MTDILGGIYYLVLLIITCLNCLIVYISLFRIKILKNTIVQHFSRYLHSPPLTLEPQMLCKDELGQQRVMDP